MGGSSGFSADFTAVRVHGFGRAFLCVDPDFAPVPVRDRVVVVVGEQILIHDAGSD